MGTFLVISIDKAHKEVINQIHNEITRIEEKFSRYKENSLVQKINNNKNSWINVDDEFLYVLEKSLFLYSISDGTFNILVGEIVKEWGFYDGNYKIPDEDTLEKLIKEAKKENIIVDEKNKRVKLLGGSIDFGGIVKGYALDKIKEILINNKVKEAIVNLGGNILVYGDRVFKIGVKHPREDGIIHIFELKGGEAISTSGDYENYFVKDGIRYHHIIDPKIGKPSKSGLIEVSVISDSGILGDGLSTTIFVLGKNLGEELIKTYFPNITLLIVDENLNKVVINENR